MTVRSVRIVVDLTFAPRDDHPTLPGRPDQLEQLGVALFREIGRLIRPGEVIAHGRISLDPPPAEVEK